MTDSDSSTKLKAKKQGILTASQLPDVLVQLESKAIDASVSAYELLTRSLQSTRESWLVSGLWEHCMKSCSEPLCKLIASTPDTHSGRLFEKLNDGLMKSKTRLSSIIVLGYIIRQEPTWLYKISGTPLFETIMTCLKTENNISILMNAILTVAALLPSIPVAVGPRLHGLFNAFMRFTNTFSTGYRGDVAEVLFVHLRVAVYHFFCRLYAMYPRNFISFLQDQCVSGHFHARETQEAIQSFLLSVRLHPQLVLGSQQGETSTSKWRGLDAQAIEVECSQVSVDSNSQDYAVNPLTNVMKTLPRMLSSHSLPHVLVPQSIHSRHKYADANPGVQRYESDGALGTEGDGQSSLSSALLHNQFWSPTIALGLATPPPSRSISPSGSSHDSSSFMASRLGDDFSQRSTPATTPGYRGLPYNLPETESSASSTSAPTQSSSTASSKIASHRGSGASSGKQSPTKHGESPSQSRKLLFPVKQGAELQLLSQTVVEESSSTDNRNSLMSNNSGMARMSSSPKVMLDPDRKEATVVYSAVSGVDADSVTVDSNMTDVPKPESAAVLPDELNREEITSTASFSRSRHLSLSHWMDALTGDERQSHHDDTKAKLLAQIRLKAGDMPVPHLGHHLRASSVDISHSLPTLATAPARYRSTDDINKTLESHSVPPDFVARPAHLWKGVGRESYSAESLPDMTMLKKRHHALFSPVQPAPTLEVSGLPEQRMESSQCGDCKSSAEITVDHELHCSELVSEVFALDESVEAVHVCGRDSLPCEKDDNNDDNDDEPGDRDKEDGAHKQSVSFSDVSSPRTVVRTFSHLLPSVLPVPAFLSKEESEPETEQTPAGHGNEARTGLPHSQLSPAAILDRMLELGSAMHAKKSSCIPMTYLEGTDWSHFGESPQADEVAILKSQLLLLHAQLLYERHQGQQHARRNRSLLSKAFQAEKMTEQLWSLERRLQLQQEDMKRLSAQALFEQEREQAKLESSHKMEKALRLQLKICTDENLVLRETEASAVEKAQSLQTELDRLQEVLHKKDAKIFTLESNIADLRPKAAATEQLQQQVDCLSHEVLVLSEILEDQRQREQQHEMMQARLIELEMALETARNELKRQDKFKQQHQQLLFLREKVFEQEATIGNMTQATKQHKSMIENVKSRCAIQLKALEEKCSALKVANHSLEAHIMELYGRLEHNSAGHRIHVAGTGSDSSSLGSTPGTGTLTTLFSRSSDSFSALPPH